MACSTCSRSSALAGRGRRRIDGREAGAERSQRRALGLDRLLRRVLELGVVGVDAQVRGQRRVAPQDIVDQLVDEPGERRVARLRRPTPRRRRPRTDSPRPQLETSRSGRPTATQTNGFDMRLRSYRHARPRSAGPIDGGAPASHHGRLSHVLRVQTPRQIDGLVPRGVTLSFLAEQLNLSPASVSLVLNKAPAADAIPQRTKDRIIAAAKEFGYQPHSLARSLARRRSLTIGVLIPDVSEGYVALALGGVEDYLLQAGYLYFLASHRHRDDLVDEYKKLLVDRAVEGIIALDTPFAEPLPVPVVAISGHQAIDGVTNIEMDHARAAQLAIRAPRRLRPSPHRRHSGAVLQRRLRRALGVDSRRRATPGRADRSGAHGAPRSGTI